MKIMVLGAYGQLGQQICRLAAQQNWQLTAVAHKEHPTIALGSATLLLKDIRKLTFNDVQGFDAVVDATGGWQPKTAPIIYQGLAKIVQLLNNSQTRYLKVGGANTLFINRDHSQQLQNLASYYPAKFHFLCEARQQALTLLRTYSAINWTYVTPPINFISDGPATGHYQVTGEEFQANLRGDDGLNDYISYADFAQGIIDILAKPQFLRQQITLTSGNCPTNFK